MLPVSKVLHFVSVSTLFQCPFCFNLHFVAVFMFQAKLCGHKKHEMAPKAVNFGMGTSTVSGWAGAGKHRPNLPKAFCRPPEAGDGPEGCKILSANVDGKWADGCWATLTKLAKGILWVAASSL